MDKWISFCFGFAILCAGLAFLSLARMFFMIVFRFQKKRREIIDQIEHIRMSLPADERTNKIVCDLYDQLEEIDKTL